VAVRGPGLEGVAVGAANDQLAEAVRARPDRFAAFATTPLQHPAEGADELSRAIEQLGLVGTMLFGQTGGRYLGDRSFDPFWEYAQDFIRACRSSRTDEIFDRHMGLPTGHPYRPSSGHSMAWRAFLRSDRQAGVRRSALFRHAVDAGNDCVRGPAQRLQFLRAKSVDEQLTHSPDVPRCCPLQVGVTGVGQDRVRIPPVTRIGLAAQETALLKTADHVRQARQLRVDHDRELAHPHAAPGLIGQQRQHGVLGEAELGVPLKLPLKRGGQPPQEFYEPAPGRKLVSGQPGRFGRLGFPLRGHAHSVSPGPPTPDLKIHVPAASIGREDSSVSPSVPKGTLMSDLKLAIILGSTRPGRNGKAVADWVLTKAKERTSADYELIDLIDYPLPHLDEPVPPSLGKYAGEHTKAWAAKISEYDGYVFVTPEYNHSTSGVLKNAIDYLYAEWNNKAAAFVSYGNAGGARAIEHLRAVSSELQLAHVRQTLTFSLMTDFENFSVFTPAAHHDAAAVTLFTQLESWADALKAVRH